MTDATLEATAQEAAATLLASLDDLDTEAALASLLAGEHPAPAEVADRPRRRALLVAAALIVVAGLAGAAAVARQGSDDATVATAPGDPVDPASFGPVLGRLPGASDPDLQAVVHGPTALAHGDEVAISITGGVAGFTYGAQLCAEGDGPAFCTGFEPVVIDDEGSALLVVRLPAVFAGAVPHVNDCRAVPCRLLVDVMADDTQTDADVAIGSLAPRARTDGLAGIDLAFDPEAPAPAVPSVELERAGIEKAGLPVRVTGRDLHPGTWLIVAEGAPFPWSGPLRHQRGTHRAELAEVVVDETGVVDATATLPLGLSLATDGSGGSARPPKRACSTRTPEGTWCAVRLELTPASAQRIADETGAIALQPDAVPYPGS